MKFRIAAIAALLAIAGCSGTSGGGLEKTNIVVDAFPAIDSAGLFIAQMDGLFKQQGLNVTINLAQNSQEAITGQLAGKYDITSADYVTYVDNVLVKKAPLRIIAESSFLRARLRAGPAAGRHQPRRGGGRAREVPQAGAPGRVAHLAAQLPDRRRPGATTAPRGRHAAIRPAAEAVRVLRDQLDNR
jgi:hypothetical protein